LAVASLRADVLGDVPTYADEREEGSIVGFFIKRAYKKPA